MTRHYQETRDNDISNVYLGGLLVQVQVVLGLGELLGQVQVVLGRDGEDDDVVQGLQGGGLSARFR